MCILFLCHTLGDSAGGTLAPSPPSDLPFDSKKSTKCRNIVNPGIAGKYKLVVASNRDEDLDRPTDPLHFWADTKSNLLAGRDTVAGGTWLGVNRSGKFATVTNIPSVWDDVVNLAHANVRSIALASSATAVAAVASAATSLQRRQGSGGGDGDRGWAVIPVGLLCAGVLTASLGVLVAVSSAMRRSRGLLVSNFLKGDEDAQQYCTRLSKECWRYPGFNLVLTDASGAWVLSNRDQARVTRLPYGLYGVSNATLDTPWAKLLHGKSRVLQVLAHATADPKLTEDDLVDLLMDVLADDTPCSTWKEHSWWRFREWHRALARVCVRPTPVPRLFRMSWPWTSNTPPATTRPTEAQVTMAAATAAAAAVSSASSAAAAERYGTRSSTVVLLDASGRMKVVERNLGRNGDGTVGTMRDAKQTQFEFCDV